MDDIRRPHQPQRRDYTVPTHRPQHTPHTPQPAETPHHLPHHHLPTPHQAHSDQPRHPTPHQQPHHQPTPYAHQRTYEQTQPAQQPTYRSQPETTQHVVTPQRAKRRGLKITLIVIAPFLVAGIFAAGYSLKSSNDSNTIPASITKQANFDLFFPSPMPAGYTYMKNTATFQIGQVFYKFSNNRKRVTVNEQPMPATKPNFNLLNGYEQFSSAVGQAAIGTTLGESTAYVLAGNTLITMNSSGGVTKDELKTAVNNLKNIGQNPSKK